MINAGLRKLAMATAAAGCVGRLIAADVAVVKPGASKTPLDLDGWSVRGPEAEQVRNVIEEDLRRSGWFEIVARGGVVNVRGECSRDGGRLVATCAVSSQAAGKVFMRRGLQEDAASARRLAHAIADDIVLAVKGVPGIASSRIAMLGQMGKGKEIFLCDADGANHIQLTQDKAVCLSPSWSPDRRALVYTSFLNGYPDVYRVDLDSGRRRRIAGFAGLNSGADISPDGRSMTLTLSKDGNPELYVMDLRDGRVSRLTKTKEAAEASPTWSPDGQQIAFVSDKTGAPQIYVMSRSGGGAVRITFRGAENVAPDWGYGGRIAFSSRREGRYQICVYDPASRVETQFTADGADHEDPSWAPDGRHIAYVRTDRYHSDIYLLDTGGDPQVRLTTIPGEWHSPAWSP